ncbi:hypothetical protein V495_00661 [Pseudogymnoascus sp. VKM F-4514 (FW-929)]|nr:hypothetical protein V495_00661 [Pseudogymnoascus sp. VKM F-4514 (FW-929)]
MLRRPIFTRPLTRQLLGNSSDTELDAAGFRSRNGYLQNLLVTHRGSPNCYWGFVIIRTTYTPESDLQWPVAMAKLSDWLRVEMRTGSNASDNEQELVVKKFRNLVADNKALYNGLPMSDAVLRFEDILDEQYNIALNYSTPEHFDKTPYYRIPEFVEQSLAESDPEVKRDLLEASYWRLNDYICLVIDEESLKDLVELPAEHHCFDLASALKEIREHPDGPPPARRIAHLKVAMRHSDFDLMDREDWYTQWAKWSMSPPLYILLLFSYYSFEPMVLEEHRDIMTLTCSLPLLLLAYLSSSANAQQFEDTLVGLDYPGISEDCVNPESRFFLHSEEQKEGGGGSIIK